MIILQLLTLFPRVTVVVLVVGCKRCGMRARRCADFLSPLWHSDVLMTVAAGRRGSAASADDDRPRAQNLVNKQKVLPFVPPAFPTNAPDRLIKPSEYLKTITAPCKRDDSAAEARPPPPPPVPANMPPPPPPQPPAPTQQPLAGISSADLLAVRLRSPATKTMSAPPARSVSLQCLNSAENYRSAKVDLIEELKMSKDITGIKKMKVERARRESLQDKETFTKFTAENFVDQVSVSALY